MKRKGNLFDQIICIDNLRMADQRARKGKSNQYGVKIHIENAESNLELLHNTLKTHSFKTSEYSVFKVYEPKERNVYRLPYFPDRIVHHAIMNVLEPLFVAFFTRDTYSCIKGRGIHAAATAVKTSLKDVPGTQYCLKLDIEKFYPSVNHLILKQLLRKKFKDPNLHMLLDEIIDSAEGLPIGNYLSQYFSNFYLTYFDYWIKRTKRIKYYFRYADDIVILSSDKPGLHQLLFEIGEYLKIELELKVKKNYQIFPVKSRGIDFVGYRFYHTHTKLRKRIKKNFARMIATRKNKASIASYRGWANHADTKHLLKKLLNEN